MVILTARGGLSPLLRSSQLFSIKSCSLLKTLASRAQESLGILSDWICAQDGSRWFLRQFLLGSFLLGSTGALQSKADYVFNYKELP